MPRKQKQNRKPDLILLADLHTRETQPVAWQVDYVEAQIEAHAWLLLLCNEYDCPVVVAGDVLDKWKVSPWLESWFIEHWTGYPLYVVPGQHDLPQHNIDLLDRSSLNVLRSAGVVHIIEEGEPLRVAPQASMVPVYLHGYPFGARTGRLATKTRDCGRHIAVVHEMTYKSKLPWPGCKADNADKLLKKMAGYDLVLTGDNHKPCTAEAGGRHLVNPGSFMRMTAGQIDHKPRVYLYYASDNTYEKVYVPQGTGCINREHIEHEQQRDDRIDAFVKRLKDDVEIGMSFKANLVKAMDAGSTRPSVRKLVYEVMDMEEV